MSEDCDRPVDGSLDGSDLEPDVQEPHVRLDEVVRVGLSSPVLLVGRRDSHAHSGGGGELNTRNLLTSEHDIT